MSLTLDAAFYKNVVFSSSNERDVSKEKLFQLHTRVCAQHVCPGVCACVKFCFRSLASMSAGVSARVRKSIPTW